MKVCNVVLDSVWFDPRVRKQIKEYNKNVSKLVTIGCLDARYNQEKISEVPCKTIIVGANYKYGNSILSKISISIKRKRDLKKSILNEKPDIIHANDLDALKVCYPVAKKLKCKLIYDSHELCVENMNLKGIRKKIDAYYEKKIVKKVDLMVCVSNAAAEYFQKKYNIPRPLVVTNCSLKSEIYCSDVKNDKFEILNHGQFYEGRGYDLMIEAGKIISKNKDIVLALRGFGKLESSLKERAKELELENVIFYPPVLVNELIKYASKSMVGVAITEPICLNFELSVSNKLFEYCSAGLPVIMSNIPEHRYLNDKYKFGLIIERNTPECFAEAVLKLYEDKEFYNQCAKNAKILSDEINWENEFMKLIKIEKDLLNEK